LGDAHWDHFFTEPRYGKYRVESRKHRTWRKGLYVLERAAVHLREHTRGQAVATIPLNVRTGPRSTSAENVR
jgi:hypothetical protein